MPFLYPESSVILFSKVRNCVAKEGCFRTVLLAVICGLLVVRVKAEPAMDYLGGAKYKEAILAGHPAGWGAGFFATEFDDAYGVAEALLGTGKCPLIRVHLIYNGQHTYSDADIHTIKTQAQKWAKLKEKFPTKTIEISPFCEHRLQDPDKYLDIVHQHAPGCKVINNPEPGGNFSTRYENEIHTTAWKIRPKGNFNLSFDGEPTTASNLKHAKIEFKKASVIFLWHPRFNGKSSADDSTVVSMRHHWPDAAFIRELAAHY